MVAKMKEKTIWQNHEVRLPNSFAAFTCSCSIRNNERVLKAWFFFLIVLSYWLRAPITAEGGLPMVIVKRGREDSPLRGGDCCCWKELGYGD